MHLQSHLVSSPHPRPLLPPPPRLLLGLLQRSGSRPRIRISLCLTRQRGAGRRQSARRRSARRKSSADSSAASRTTTTAADGTARARALPCVVGRPRPVMSVSTATVTALSSTKIAIFSTAGITTGPTAETAGVAPRFNESDPAAAPLPAQIPITLPPTAKRNASATAAAGMPTRAESSPVVRSGVGGDPPLRVSASLVHPL